MKQLLLCSFLVCWSLAVRAQDSINPYHIALADTIILQNTDVYYRPFAPPVPTDTREQLCILAKQLRDPDGVIGLYTYDYDPMTNGQHITTLYGDTALWTRLFQAVRKADGTPTDIIAGSNVTNDTMKTNGHHGEVIINKNEDVDFRASGMIKLEAGVHGMPGGFFHAYIEPRWKTTDSCSVAGDSGKSLLFCDEFDSSSLNKWAIFDSVGNGGVDWYKASNLQSNVTNVGALDGKSLSITLREDSSERGGWSLPLRPTIDPCLGSVPGCTILASLNPLESCNPNNLASYPFSTGQLFSCPWPFKSADTIWTPVSQNLPYGKYEIRDYLPMGLYHSNSYSSDVFEDWNLAETEFQDSTKIEPGLSHDVWYGPFKGKFGSSLHGPVGFRSEAANFSLTNNPIRIIINGFPYAVGGLYYDGGGIPFDTNISFDNNTYFKGGIPSSFLAADSVTFYYERTGSNKTDSLLWSVDSTGTYFTGVYSVDNHGDSLRFNKNYQPTQISFLPGVDTFSCHWDHTTGKLMLGSSLPSIAPHSGTGHVYYWCEEGCPYPLPPVHLIANQWHTWTMELLPHECRFLVDGIVVHRIPDHLIPPTYQQSDFVSYFPRMLTPFILGEFELDGYPYYPTEKSDLVARYGTNVSRFVDYMRVWDLPSNYTVPQFPH